VWVIVTVFHFTINHPFSSFKRLDSIPGTITRPQAGKLRKCGPIPDTGMALFCSPKCPELLLNHPTLPFNRYQELFPSKVTTTWGWSCTSITASPPQPYICLASMVLDSAQGHYRYHFIRLAPFYVVELLTHSWPMWTWQSRPWYILASWTAF
jgi:hypothetical protein